MRDRPFVLYCHPYEFDPDEFSAADQQAAFAEGVRLFDAGDYHAAHEAFEKCWLANEAGDADFFKGLIQAAICLHHLGRGNVDGARKLLRGHRSLLGRFLPTHRGVDVAAFLAQMQRVVAPALDAQAETRFLTQDKPRLGRAPGATDPTPPHGAGRPDG